MLSYRRNVIIFTFMFCLVASACTGNKGGQLFTQSPQASKQSTPEIESPTIIPLTLKPSNSLRSTQNLMETATITPSYTSIIHVNTINPTETIQAMLTEQASALRYTQIAGFSATCDDSDVNIHPNSLSPKGNLLAISCGYKRNQTLQIYSKTGKKWVVQFKDYVDKQFIRDGQTMGLLYPTHWTNDETYLYFISALGISAGGTCFYGGWGQGLYRLNIDNGSVSATLPLLMGGDLYIFSFSPSGRWLAYNSGIPTILDLQTGEEIILYEGNNAVGDFTWSPDGSKLVYAICQPSEDYSTIKKSGIKIFSLETRESKTILETETEYVFLRIDLEDVNRLKIYDYFISPPNYLYFDWSTEMLIAPTLTLTP